MSEPASTLNSAAPAKADLSTAANELRAMAEAKVLQFTEALKSEDLKPLTNRAVNEAATRWKEMSASAAVFVRESPGRAALAALGIGFTIGLLFRRD
jgi:ElaB/YqjD/DUF883 family membrane-anchored ribosome-binding protein